MPGRFPVFTDNHIRQPIIEALKRRGWDVERAVDVFGERNDDEELLGYAAREGRVFLTSDEGIHVVAHRWLREGRTFRMIYWWAERYREITDGDIVRAIEDLSQKLGAFGYSIEYIKPKA